MSTTDNTTMTDKSTMTYNSTTNDYETGYIIYA